MIRMEASRKEVERHRLVGRPFNLAGTKGACGIAIKQQTSKNFRRDGLATAWTIVGVDSTQVQVRDHVDAKAGQMVRRQTFAQRDGGIEGCFVIGGFEFSAHVPSVRCVSACGQRVLSDRLLGACPRKKSLKNNALKLRRDDFKISHFPETRVLTGGQNFCTFLKNC